MFRPRSKSNSATDSATDRYPAQQLDLTANKSKSKSRESRWDESRFDVKPANGVVYPAWWSDKQQKQVRISPHDETSPHDDTTMEVEGLARNSSKDSSNSSSKKQAKLFLARTMAVQRASKGHAKSQSSSRIGKGAPWGWKE